MIKEKQKYPMMGKHVDGAKLSLDDWLHLVLEEDPELVFPNNCFPTDKMSNKYISTIAKRSEKEVKNLMRLFLVHNCRYGSDELHREFLLHQMENDIKNFEKMMDSEYHKRLFFNSECIWEGNTWILDLLPHFPKLAMEGLWAYMMANWQYLPDKAVDGLSDAQELIRAKFIEPEHPKETFLKLLPREFELLIAKVYEAMDYKIQLTKRSHDGGIDVIAIKNGELSKEKILIQCKRYDSNVGISKLRELLGVVSDKKATKGVLVSSSKFTLEVKKFVNQNHRLEIIDHKSLSKLCNTYLGSDWNFRLTKILTDCAMRYEKYAN